MKPYNYMLDLMRIVAIVMIIAAHTVGFWTDNMPGIVNIVFSYGAYGVGVFFFLCGYFSVQSVISSKSTKSYIEKKARRILLPYYLSWVFTFLIGGMILNWYPISWEWVYSLFFMQMYIPTHEWSWWAQINFFWTMPSIVAWYIISFLLFKKKRNIYTLSCITFISIIFIPQIKMILSNYYDTQLVNWNTLCLLYVFLLGAMANIAIVSNKCVYAVLWGIFTLTINIIINNLSGYLFVSFFIFFLVMFLSISKLLWKKGWLGKYCRRLSNYSYEVYLTQWFVIVIFGSYISTLDWYVGLPFVIVVTYVTALALRKICNFLLYMISKIYSCII